MAHYLEQASNGVPFRTYEADASEGILDNAFQWAAGQVALRLATARHIPEEWPDTPDHLQLTGQPLSEFDGSDIIELDPADSIRARRFGFAAAISAGMCEHNIDWASITGSDNPVNDVRLLPFDNEEATLASASTPTERLKAFDSREIRRCMTAVARWREAMLQNPQAPSEAGSSWGLEDYVTALHSRHDEILEADPSSQMTIKPVTAKVAAFGDGPIIIGSLMGCMLELRNNPLTYPNSGLQGLSREKYVEAIHGGAGVLLYQARFSNSRLGSMPLMMMCGPKERQLLDLSRVHFRRQHHGDGYVMEHDGQYTHAPQPGDESMIGRRITCPTRLLSPDNPNITFRPSAYADRPPSGFHSYLETYIHATINTAADAGVFMPDDFE